MSDRSRRAGGLAACATILFGALLALVPSDRARQPDVVTGPPRGDGRGLVLDPAWLARLEGVIARSEYDVSSGLGGLEAPNRRHNLRASFHSAGVTVRPRVRGDGEPWRWSWTTTRWGRPGRLESPGPRVASHEGGAVHLVGRGLTEWYVNDESGLEQGFTVYTRPAGDGDLWIEGDVAVSAGLRLELEADRLIARDKFDAVTLEYSGLRAWDSRRQTLPARFEREGDRLRLVIDDRGAVYPVVVDPLLTSPLATLVGTQTQARFGAAVTTAGDVNGDGFSDVLVGAPRYDNGQADEGRVFLFLGSESGPQAPAAWTAEGDQDSADFGAALAAAGDIDLDGYDDVIVGAPRYGLLDQGRALVYYGAPGGFEPTPWIRDGTHPGGMLGTAVATARDVNGDRHPDILIGIPGFDSVGTDRGKAQLFLGSASGLAAGPSWSVNGPAGLALFGLALAGAGDLNADGFADAVIGAPAYSGGQGGEGAILVYAGSALGLSASPVAQRESNQAGARLGRAVGQAGDVNGDGRGDIIVGSPGHDGVTPNEGRASVFFGDTATYLAAAAPWTREGGEDQAHLGAAVGTAGDIDGDGYADVIIGADSLNSGGVSNAGAFFVYRGSPSGPTAEDSARVNGTQVNERLGVSVLAAGDVDGDGFGDVIAGAVGYNANLGRASVYRGTPRVPRTQPLVTVSSSEAGTHFGRALAVAGDVDGDGFLDVIVGEPSANASAGRARLYRGTASGLDTIPVWTSNGDQPGAAFGYAVAAAGDVNGDGYSDVMVGAPYRDQVLEDRGRAYLFYGAPGPGLLSSASWFADGPRERAHFGHAVTGAGDVDGNGFGDLLIGAPNDSVDGIRGKGSAFLYHGKGGGPGATPAWTATADQSTSNPANFGHALARAGDVNGDGLSDVVIGAPQYEPVGLPASHGAAFVYLGVSGGALTTSAVRLRGGPQGDRFGGAVAGAGDVDGDRLSDVLVGDATYGPTTTEGAVYLFRGIPSGIDSMASWRRTGTPDLYLGQAVCSARDVNADGFSDVLIGAIRDSKIPFEGAAYLHLGSAVDSALSGAPDWSVTGGESHAGLGAAVAAGDVTGDGFADLIVGMSFETSVSPDFGRLRVYAGNGGPGRFRGVRAYWKGDSTRLVSGPGGITGYPDGFVGCGSSTGPGGRDWKGPRLFHFRAAGSTPFTRGPHGTMGGGGACEALCDSTEGDKGRGEDQPICVGPINPDPATPYWYSWQLTTDSPYFPHGPVFASPLVEGRYEYSVRVPADTVVGVPSPDVRRVGLRLGPAIPNAFRHRCRIHYVLAHDAHVRLTIHDVQGRVVARLIDRVETAGVHAVDWDGRDRDRGALPSGIYLAHLRAGGETRSLKLVLVR